MYYIEGRGAFSPLPHFGEHDRMQPAAMSFRAELHAGMGSKGFRLIETLSREISGRHGAHTIEKGDFSTPLRSGRNDRVTTARCMPLHPLLCNNICPTDVMYRDPLLSLRMTSGRRGRIGYSAPYLNDRKQPAAMSFRAELHAGMGSKGFRLIETLSREISGRHGAHTIEKGDFSTPLRSGRNDRGTTARCMPPRLSVFNNICPTDAMYRDPSLRSG